jgi:hypothetical protein
MKISWDHEIPNIWKNKPNVPKHQPDQKSLLPFIATHPYHIVF